VWLRRVAPHSVKRTSRITGDCGSCAERMNLPNLPHRKANANILAVDERQSLKTLDREFKTATRSLDQLRERVNGFEEQRNKLDRDADEVQRRADDVSRVSQSVSLRLTTPFSWKIK
jgi:hypothetical protein